MTENWTIMTSASVSTIQADRIDFGETVKFFIGKELVAVVRNYDVIAKVRDVELDQKD